MHFFRVRPFGSPSWGVEFRIRVASSTRVAKGVDRLSVLSFVRVLVKLPIARSATA